MSSSPSPSSPPSDPNAAGDDRQNAAGVDRHDERAAAPTTVGRVDEPAARCPYCGRPFRVARLETLHRGLEHPERLSDRERAAFERAAREERAAIRRYRLLALGAVILLYFGFLILYAIVA